MACTHYIRADGFKLKESRHRLDTKKKCFTMRVVKHWYGLPREVVECPSLKALKVRLDWALNNLIQLKMSLLAARQLH